MDNINKTETTEGQSLSDMFGMKFNEDGSLSSAETLGNTNRFRKKNHQERRIEAAIERRRQKRIKKWGK